jgi:glutaminyl-peptide cyclotransferase
VTTKHEPRISPSPPAPLDGGLLSRRQWLVALAGSAGLAGAAGTALYLSWPSDRAIKPPRNGGSPGKVMKPRRYTYKVVNVYPHDREAFTQGLVFDGGFLYESTGMEGRSSLRQVELKTGRVVQRVDIPGPLFAEGIALWGDEIVQLTWKHQLGLVYDRDSFQEKRRFRYTGEGWGLAHDGRHLIMSDGTSTLRFLDPDTYAVVRKLPVTAEGWPQEYINELEYADGEILANIWYDDRMARIDPASGQITGWIDLTGLLPFRQRRENDVLNGIAYDAQKKRLFVTGKNWPKLFEIRIVPID